MTRALVLQRLDTRTQVDTDAKNRKEGPCDELRRLDRSQREVSKAFVRKSPAHEEPLDVEVDIHAYATTEDWTGSDDYEGCSASSAHWMQSVAYGSALSRASAMGSSQPVQRPYSPASRRAKA